MKFLKAYGALRGQEEMQAEPAEFACVSVQASPEVLRQLAEFFSTCADRIELARSTDPMMHFHLRDDWEKWRPTFADFVVVPPPARPKTKIR